MTFLLNKQLCGKPSDTKLSPSTTRSTTNKNCCPYKIAPEQKARVTYDNILRMCDDPDVSDVIRFLREREVVHFQRFGEAVRLAKEKMNQKNVYFTNPAFDK